jgi:hypothetical protein
MAQLSPMNSWKSISPWVVVALKFGAIVTVRRRIDSIESGTEKELYQSTPDADGAVPGGRLR